MNAPQIDVAYISKLAKIELTPEETESFSTDLNRILGYVAQLGEWDTDGVAPMYHPLPVYDAVRADAALPSLSNDAALSNAPAETDGQFRVPKVVESAH